MTEQLASNGPAADIRNESVRRPLAAARRETGSRWVSAGQKWVGHGYAVRQPATSGIGCAHPWPSSRSRPEYAITAGLRPRTTHARWRSCDLIVEVNDREDSRTFGVGVDRVNTITRAWILEPQTDWTFRPAPDVRGHQLSTKGSRTTSVHPRRGYYASAPKNHDMRRVCPTAVRMDSDNQATPNP